MRRPSRIAAAAGFGAAQQRFAQGTPFDAPKGNPEQATVFRGASKPSGRTLHDTRAMFGLEQGFPVVFRSDPGRRPFTRQPFASPFSSTDSSAFSVARKARPVDGNASRVRLGAGYFPLLSFNADAIEAAVGLSLCGRVRIQRRCGGNRSLQQPKSGGQAG
jgi:hypothetical protein